MIALHRFYTDKRIMITGHAGFKGAWLAHLLQSWGASVAGYSLLSDTTYTMYDIMALKHRLDMNCIADICDIETLQKIFIRFQPDIVIHLAAQAIVRKSYTNPFDTYKTNVLGTLALLETARQTSSVRAFVNVTTDKCYENIEKNYFYNEEDPLGGYDMYSSSKACSEILTSSYRRSFLNKEGFALASARAGNVIGGGDWAVDRLIPDCIRAFSEEQTVHIRNPVAVRPWQHVLEPLMGYLILAQKLFEKPQSCSTAYNFGPEKSCILKVADVATLAANAWNIPHGNATVTVGTNDELHEAGLLQLDITKAKKELHFQPVWSAYKAISKTIQWYKSFYNNNKTMVAYTDRQISDYIIDAQKKEIFWSAQ